MQLVTRNYIKFPKWNNALRQLITSMTIPVIIFFGSWAEEEVVKMLPLCNFYFHDNFLHFFSLFQVPTSATFYFELKMPSELNYSKYPPQLNSTPIPFSQEINCMKLKIIGIIFPKIFLSFWGALNVVWCCVIIFFVITHFEVFRFLPSRRRLPSISQ